MVRSNRRFARGAGLLAAVAVSGAHAALAMLGVGPLGTYTRQQIHRLDWYTGGDWLYFLLPVLLYVPLAGACVPLLAGGAGNSARIWSRWEGRRMAARIAGLVLLLAVLAYSPLFALWLQGTWFPHSGSIRHILYYRVMRVLLPGVLLLLAAGWVLRLMPIGWRKNGGRPAGDGFLRAGALAAVFHLRNFIYRVNFDMEGAWEILARSAPWALGVGVLILFYGLLCAVVLGQVGQKHSSTP